MYGKAVISCRESGKSMSIHNESCGRFFLGQNPGATDIGDHSGDSVILILLQGIYLKAFEKLYRCACSSMLRDLPSFKSLMCERLPEVVKISTDFSFKKYHYDVLYPRLKCHEDDIK